MKFELKLTPEQAKAFKEIKEGDGFYQHLSKYFFEVENDKLLNDITDDIVSYIDNHPIYLRENKINEILDFDKSVKFNYELTISFSDVNFD